MNFTRLQIIITTTLQVTWPSGSITLTSPRTLHSAGCVKNSIFGLQEQSHVSTVVQSKKKNFFFIQSARSASSVSFQYFGGILHSRQGKKRHSRRQSATPPSTGFSKAAYCYARHGQLLLTYLAQHNRILKL